jgi:hypothetical protein
MNWHTMAHMSAVISQFPMHISRRTLDRYVASGKLAALYLPSGHRRFRALDVSRVLKSPAVPSSPEVDGAAGVSFVST